VLNALVHDVGDTHPTGPTDTFETCGDVDSIAKNVVFVYNDITEVDSNSILDPRISTGGRLSDRHRFLNRNRTINGIDHADKLGKHAVSGRFHDSSVVLLDQRIDQINSVAPLPVKCPQFVDFHEPRKTHHVRNKHCSESPFVLVRCRRHCAENYAGKFLPATLRLGSADHLQRQPDTTPTREAPHITKPLCVKWGGVDALNGAGDPGQGVGLGAARGG